MYVYTLIIISEITSIYSKRVFKDWKETKGTDTDFCSYLNNNKQLYDFIALFTYF